MIYSYFWRGLGILVTVLFFSSLGLFYGGVLRVQAGALQWNSPSTLGPLAPIPGSQVSKIRELYLNAQAGYAHRCTTSLPLSRVLSHYKAKLSRTSVYKGPLFSQASSPLGKWHQGVFSLKLGPLHMLAAKDTRGNTLVLLAYREGKQVVYYLFSGREKRYLRPTPLPPFPFSSQVFSLEEKQKALYGYTSTLPLDQATIQFQKALEKQNWKVRHRAPYFLLLEKENQQCWLFFSSHSQGCEVSIFLFSQNSKEENRI